MYNVYDLRVLIMDKLKEFKQNIFKHTVLRIVLPAIFFLAVTALFLILARDQAGNNKNGAYFFVYMAIVFFLFFLIYLLRLIKGKKVYVVRKKRKKEYRYINKTEYQQLLRSFDNTKIDYDT